MDMNVDMDMGMNVWIWTLCMSANCCVADISP
jgi:hypothetical protein